MVAMVVAMVVVAKFRLAPFSLSRTPLGPLPPFGFQLSHGGYHGGLLRFPVATLPYIPPIGDRGGSNVLPLKQRSYALSSQTFRGTGSDQVSSSSPPSLFSLASSLFYSLWENVGWGEGALYLYRVRSRSFLPSLFSFSSVRNGGWKEASLQ